MSLPDPQGLDSRALVACGDWACAHANPEGLAAVAEELGPRVGEDERATLREVARLTEVDMLEASQLWAQVTHRLRERFFGHERDDLGSPA